MGYIGLSLLVVSISYFCYRHPPASWILPDWFCRSSIRDLRRGGSIKEIEKNAPGRSPDEGREKELNGIPETSQNGLQIPKIVHSEEETPTEEVEVPQIIHEADLDRKTMPPLPPPSSTRPVSKPPVPLFNTTFSPSKSAPKPPVPLLATSSPSSSASKPPVPLFTTPPSTPTPSPSRAMFPALNSHQRASSGTNAPPRLPPPPSFTSSKTSSNNLMAPPTRPISSLPNRGPPSTQTSLFPPASHTSIPTKPSKKVQLSPGRSPLDWARLTSSPEFTQEHGSLPYIRVPPSLLKKHNGRKGRDAWTVLGGKVYDITPYMEYHPGGIPELMKCAGREGTRLFGEVHPWVNWEGMLEGCLVGLAVEEGKGESGGGGGLEEMD